MEQNQLNEIRKAIKSSVIINSYLKDYLKDDIDRIIDDYDLDIERMADDEEPHIIGYYYGFNDNIHVTINFFDECSENGIGIEEIDVNLTDFITWVNENY